jgi:hypothetical protein
MQIHLLETYLHEIFVPSSSSTLFSVVTSVHPRCKFVSEQNASFCPRNDGQHWSVLLLQRLERSLDRRLLVRKFVIVLNGKLSFHRSALGHQSCHWRVDLAKDLFSRRLVVSLMQLGREYCVCRIV